MLQVLIPNTSNSSIERILKFDSENTLLMRITAVLFDNEINESFRIRKIIFGNENGVVDSR